LVKYVEQAEIYLPLQSAPDAGTGTWPVFVVVNVIVGSAVLCENDCILSVVVAPAIQQLPVPLGAPVVGLISS